MNVLSLWRPTLVTVLLCAACGPSTHVLKGSLSAPDCGGGYNLNGAAVTVTNEKGEIIGSGTASAVMRPESSPVPGQTQLPVRDVCIATFTVSVPDAKFYQVKVGTHNGPVYSSDDMAKSHFTVTLSLGGN